MMRGGKGDKVLNNPELLFARPKDAAAAIRKRLTGNTKNFHIINLTLTVGGSNSFDFSVATFTTCLLLHDLGAGNMRQKLWYSIPFQDRSKGLPSRLDEGRRCQGNTTTKTALYTFYHFVHPFNRTILQLLLENAFWV